jgi:periplasmic divalent cation tolerance protein
VARVLVDERLAACVTLLGPATSVYRWQGTVESAQESPLLIKVAAERLPALQERLLQLHPYDLPELIALPVVAGLSAYIDWALAASRPG